MPVKRRGLLKRMGAAGASISAVSIAGYTDSDGGAQNERENVEQELPDERRMGGLTHLSNTERYWPERYQSNILIDRRLREELGIPVEVEPLEISSMAARYNTANPPDEPADGDFWTHNWCAAMGDPDSIIYDRFHVDGALNYNGFDHDPYNEVAAEQRTETDEEARQELVFEAQNILGEQRPESQYLHNVYPYAVNTNLIDPDTVVITPDGPANIWNWSQMEPASEEGRTAVTNNWDPSDSMNPLHVNTVGPSRNWTPFSFMHDFLVRLDPESLQPTAWAAEDWEWTDDTTLVVTMKEGMTFHDGEPVSAEDVVYTVNLCFETEPPAYTTIVNDPLDGVEQTGDRELTFNLSEPFAPFVPVTLGQLPILPQHYWEQLIEETGTQGEPWNISFSNDRPVIGSGPFQWGTWNQGSRFEMPAYEDHPFAAPNIDTRIQRPLGTRDAELEAIKGGEYAILDYWFGAPDRLEQEVENTGHLQLFENADDCRQRMQKNCALPPNDDPAFRQAVNAAVMATQPVIIREIYGGFGTEAFSPISPVLEFWHNPDTPFFEGFDTAETILSDAGYAWDDNGNIYYPEGKTGK